MDSFRDKIGDTVTLKLSGETGIVIGRAEYMDAEEGYLLRYKGADGRQVESWWTNSAIA
jgi:hypothetical protein